MGVGCCRYGLQYNTVRIAAFPRRAAYQQSDSGAYTGRFHRCTLRGRLQHIRCRAGALAAASEYGICKRSTFPVSAESRLCAGMHDCWNHCCGTSVLAGVNKIRCHYADRRHSYMDNIRRTGSDTKRRTDRREHKRRSVGRTGNRGICCVASIIGGAYTITCRVPCWLRGYAACEQHGGGCVDVRRDDCHRYDGHRGVYAYVRQHHRSDRAVR